MLWTVRHCFSATALEAHLQQLTGDGWTVFAAMADGAGFAVVAHKAKPVAKNTSPGMWFTMTGTPSTTP